MFDIYTYHAAHMNCDARGIPFPPRKHIEIIFKFLWFASQMTRLNGSNKSLTMTDGPIDSINIESLTMTDGPIDSINIESLTMTGETVSATIEVITKSHSYRVEVTSHIRSNGELHRGTSSMIDLPRKLKSGSSSLFDSGSDSGSGSGSDSDSEQPVRKKAMVNRHSESGKESGPE